MNSLAYIARQFDAIVISSSSPPSPPPSSTHHQTTSSGSRTAWSKPLSFRQPTAKKRYTRLDQSDRRLSKHDRALPRPPTPSPNQTELSRRIRRIFIVRAFVVFWNAVCAAYNRLALRQIVAVPLQHSGEDDIETTADEKDSEEEIDLPVTRTLPTSPNLSNTPVLDFTPPTPLPSSALEKRLSQIPAQSSSHLLTPSPTPPPLTAHLIRRAPFHQPKTLVLDLDETLIHSTSRPYPSGGSGLLGFEFGNRRKAGHVVEVVLGGRVTLYHVYKRPFVDYFLRKVSGWYTVVIFTASMQEYADPVIDWLDAGRGILSRRLFRESCTQLPSGSYTKDLSVIEGDLARVCLVDNSPVSYSVNPSNGIPIEGWTHDLSDEALLDLLPVLDSLRFTSDVRRILGLRGY